MNSSKIEEANHKADLTIQEAKLSAQRNIDNATAKADKILSMAEGKNEQIKQSKILEAKDKFNRLRSEFDSQKSTQLMELKERELEILNKEKDLELKIKEFDYSKESFESEKVEIKAIRENLEKQLQIVGNKKKELETANERIIRELENIAKLSEAGAKEQLLEAVKAKAETDALSIEKNIILEAQANANKQAKKIVIQTIQRMVAEYTIENTVSVFNLDSDDIKGQIIGREGRNIRALEAATGAEIVVDDTPEAIVISSFDPIRREVARLIIKKARC